jgi:hypothetical protein
MKFKMALMAFIISLSISVSVFGECIPTNLHNPAGRLCRNQENQDDCTNKTQPGVCRWEPKESPAEVKLSCIISDDEKFAICENGNRYVLDGKAVNQLNRRLHHNLRNLKEERPPIGDGGGDGDER